MVIVDHSVYLWTPPTVRDLPIRRFIDVVEKSYNLKITSYWDLHKWSVEHYDKFWAEVWKFCNVIHSSPYENVVDTSKSIDEIPQWFSGAKLNYAENILQHNDSDKPAIYFTGEVTDGKVQMITFGQLRHKVQQYAAALKAVGVKCGDRVAGYLPNCPECVIAMLATSSIGAVWSSTSPDFGTMGVLDRLSQVEPKVLFSVDAVVYNQKKHDHLEKLEEVVKSLPTLQHVVVVPFVGSSSDIDLSGIPKSIFVDDFLTKGLSPEGVLPPLVYEQVPFNHSLFIMFSSGTTGPPKCMVHSVGGTLLKHLEEHVLQECITKDDIMLFYTTAGWMMWNWLVSVLATGAAIVLYDGSPFLPHHNVLFDLVDDIGITFLGMGAKCYTVFEDKQIRPMKTHRLTSLKAVLSTGSPLKPQSFDFIYRDIKKNLLIGSISGGTDIIACFMGASWLVSVHKGEIQVPYLGCHIQSWSFDGQPVYGERGELVCLKPFPSMPTHFLNDASNEKYCKAYFSKFNGIWAHGDYCEINPQTGGIIMLGRSDGTLNPGGIRFGSAEIYHVVESFKEVGDSLCVGQKVKDDDERVILFVKMKDGLDFTRDLVERLRSAVRQKLTARHVPAVIMQIADIPYTTSGKKVEIAVKQILAGETVLNRSALANPQSLDLFVGLKELAVSHHHNHNNNVTSN